MKRFILSVLLLLVHSFLFSQENPPLDIKHLVDHFYVYTTYKDLNGYRFPSNSMYLVTENGVVLFDTPWDTRQFQPLLDSIAVKHQKKVLMAIATHSHDDRTAGLDFLNQKGIKTYSSQLTYALCKKHQEKTAQTSFKKDTVFTVGGYKFETYYPGEGHAQDNIVIWFDQFKLLYGGCLVKSTENNNLGNLTDANLEQWPLSIKKVIEKYPNPKFVIPGHFDWTNNNGLRHTLRLIKKQQMKKKP